MSGCYLMLGTNIWNTYQKIYYVRSRTCIIKSNIKFVTVKNCEIIIVAIIILFHRGIRHNNVSY